MGTIQNIHKNKLKELSFDKKQLSKLNHEKELILNKLSEDINWIEKNKLEYKLNELIQKIDELYLNKNKNDYLLNIFEVVKEYNNPVENINEETSSEGIEQFLSKTLGKQSKKLYDCYTHIIEKSISDDYQTTDDSYKCIVCNNEKILIQNESILVCKTCGTVENYLDNNQTSITYEQEIHTESNINHGIYKRMSHFNDILLSCQAKTNVKIPEQVLEQIKLECKKYKISDIKNSTLKTILKSLGYSKYYEHVNKIKELICGETMLQIPQDIEEKLKSMFRTIQEPFEKYKPKHRTNFLSYSYCFYQLLVILDEKKYTVLFPLLKSREKLREQDQIWKQICNELNWPFYAAPL